MNALFLTLMLANPVAVAPADGADPVLEKQPIDPQHEEIVLALMEERDKKDHDKGHSPAHKEENGKHGSGGTHGVDHDAPVKIDERAREVSFDVNLFSGDPVYPEFKYDPEAQIEIYGGKTPVPGPRPIVELWRPLYARGNLGDGLNLLGEKNPVTPQLLAYGDFRTAVAYNDNQGTDIAQIAARFNLDVDMKITATERIHAFFRPIDRGNEFTRFEFGGGDFDESVDPDILLDVDPVTLFFEGDMGALLAGFTDEYKSYDLPFAFGRVPMLMQNGVWLEDAFLGGAFAIPARNSQRFDISNFDITFFAGFDEITSDAFLNSNGKRADHEAHLYGVAGFFEFDEGYLETGYAYLEDQDPLNGGDHSYHNLTVAFSKRYFGKVSNSVRVIANVGQDPGTGFTQTADGTLLLVENSLITSKPLTLVPYANFWAGFGKTQSVARAGGAEDILRNTGITFESDGLTGFPTLDATGADTVGGAIGIQNLFSLDRQLVFEVSTVVPHGNKSGPAKKTQLGAGVRYQRPLSKSVILRMDAMYGDFGANNPSSSGFRVELRRKF